MNISDKYTKNTSDISTLYKMYDVGTKVFCSLALLLGTRKASVPYRREDLGSGKLSGVLAQWRSRRGFGLEF